jgi:hypothetical protein
MAPTGKEAADARPQANASHLRFSRTPGGGVVGGKSPSPPPAILIPAATVLRPTYLRPLGSYLTIGEPVVGKMSRGAIYQIFWRERGIEMISSSW